jgi:hypothetical protein
MTVIGTVDAGPIREKSKTTARDCIWRCERKKEKVKGEKRSFSGVNNSCKHKNSPKR